MIEDKKPLTFSELSDETPVTSVVEWIRGYVGGKETNISSEQVLEKLHEIGHKSLEEKSKIIPLPQSGLSLLDISIANRENSKENMAKYVVSLAMEYDLAGDDGKLDGDAQTPLEKYLEKYDEMKKTTSLSSISIDDIVLKGPEPITHHSAGQTVKPYTGIVR